MKNLFSYTYRSEIEINAPKEKVWGILADFGSYHKWNPFTVKIDTNLELGSEVALTVKMKPGKGTTIRTEYLKAYDPTEKMVWGFSYGFLLKAERTQQLIPLNESTTRYWNADVISGLISPIVHLMYGKWIQLGFDALCHSLKDYLENGKSSK